MLEPRDCEKVKNRAPSIQLWEVFIHRGLRLFSGVDALGLPTSL